MHIPAAQTTTKSTNSEFWNILFISKIIMNILGQHMLSRFWYFEPGFVLKFRFGHHKSTACSNAYDIL